MFPGVRATPAEVAEQRAGDALLANPDVVMDRAFSVPGEPDTVWPWLVQLGKGRAGWYLSGTVERLVPPGRRALRTVEDRWQGLTVGDVIPDYGGPHETFTVAALDEPRSLVYRSRRGRTDLTWSISLRPVPGPSSVPVTRVLSRRCLASGPGGSVGR